MSSTTQLVSILILLLALATYLILTQSIRRRRPVALRPIPAFERVPLLVGEAIEADRPIHISFGDAGLGGTDTVLTLSAAELAYQIAQRNAIGVTSPVITLSNTTSIPLAQDTLRRAYALRGSTSVYRAGGTRWFPSGSQSLAFAAALTATMADDRVTGNVLVGSFGPELALILDQSNRRNIPSIATSTRLDGQAVAWALSDTPLIGEEVFTAGGYLGERAGPVAQIVTQDILRWLVVLMILLPAADVLTDGALTRLLMRLLQGQ